MAEEKNHYFMIIAIVAIVAIVALVIMVRGNMAKQQMPNNVYVTGDNGNLGGEGWLNTFTCDGNCRQSYNYEECMKICTKSSYPTHGN